MKTYIAILSLLTLLLACGKDNYDAPSSELKGRIVYNGKTIGLKGTNGAVQLQLWERGHDLFTSIPVYVKQDGTFSALLFDGEYLIVHRDGNGPWINSHDTIRITVNGSTNVDYPVKPYYLISNASYKLENNILKISFTVEGIETVRSIESISVLINKTRFVDLSSNIKKVNADEVKVGTQEISVDIKDLINKEKDLYARIALKIQGIEEAVYSTESIQVK